MHHDLVYMAKKAIGAVAQDNSVPRDQKIDELHSIASWANRLAEIECPHVLAATVTGIEKLKR
jgi:hypothetical protein